MSGYVLPVLCALLSAVLLALGSERQSAGVRALGPGAPATAGEGTRRAAVGGALRSGLAMVRSRAWLLGGLLMLGGVVLNVVALSHAPLSVVQPVGAVAVAVTTVLHARTERLRIDRRTWVAVGACMAGSVGFVLVTMQATRPDAEPTPAQEGTTILLAWAAVALGLGVALWLRRRVSAVVPTVMAGVLYGFVAVNVRLVAVPILEGRLPPLGAAAALASAGLLGVHFVQTAYRHGPPDLVVAGLTVVDPIVGVLVGVTVLDEMRPHLPAWVPAALVAAGVVATVGIAQLARRGHDATAPRPDR